MAVTSLAEDGGGGGGARKGWQDKEATRISAPTQKFEWLKILALVSA